MKKELTLAGLVVALVVLVTMAVSPVQAQTRGPFLDSFEDGDGFVTRWTTDETVVFPTDTAHNGSTALTVGDGPAFCLSWVYRTDFEANVGEYSGWFYQVNPAAGGGLDFQVQEDPDAHPSYRPGYGISVSAANSENPVFWLVRFDGVSFDGYYDILDTLPAGFSLDQWVKVVARVYPSGEIVAGYDLDMVEGLTDSIVYVDPAPILEAGRFYVTGCAANGGERNYWDDVSFIPFASVCFDRLSDIDCDGFVTALDLARLIDELFAGGPPAVPCCTPPVPGAGSWCQ